jgi:O-antigen/teichoic acid export membrane protein
LTFTARTSTNEPPSPHGSTEQMNSASDGKASVGMLLVRASGLVAFGNISSRLIALLTAIVTARLLTEIEFGAFGVVQGALNMFAIAASLNLGMGATRFVALHRAKDVNRARAVVRVFLSAGAISSVLTALLMIGAAPWLASVWLRDSSVTNPLRWAGLQLCMVAGYSLVVGILNGAERFGLSSVTSILQNVVILLSSVLLIPRFKTVGAIGAQACGFAIALVVGLWCIRDLLRGLRWQTIVKDFREEGPVLASFCLPVLLGALFIHPFSWMSLALITRGSRGFMEVAFFTAADRCRLIMLFVATFVVTALFPILSKEVKGGSDVGAGSRSLELALVGSSILLVPLSAVLAFGGPQIMLAFGRSYEVNWSVLLPLIACAGAQAHLSTIGIALLAHGKQWLAFVQQVIYGFGVLTFSFLLRGLGGTGLGLAHLLISLILVALSVPILRSLKTLTIRAAVVTITSSASICLLCLLSWVCPLKWRAALTLPLAVLMLALSAFVFASASERRRLFGLLRRSAWPPGVRAALRTTTRK